MLPKDKDFSRFKKINGLSDFEMDYYADFKSIIDGHTVDGKLEPMTMEERFDIQRRFESTYSKDRGIILK